MKMLVAMLLLAATLAVAPTEAPAFWDNGNEFLRICDSTSTFRLGVSRSDSETYSLACSMWIAGVGHGMGIEDQLRPEIKQRPAEIKAEAARAEYMKKEFGPALEIPSANVCFPDGSTIEQEKLVVIAFMKNHPGELTKHASLLAVAAFKTEWKCTN